MRGYKKNTIQVCKSDAFTIMWFISEKLRSEKKEFHLLGKIQGAKSIAREIESFFLDMNSNEIDSSLKDYPKFQEFLKEKSVKNKLFSETEFTTFRTASQYHFLGKEMEETLPIVRSEAFLDMLCIYGQNYSYQEFIDDSASLPLLENKKMKFIKTKLDYEDSSPALDLMKFIHDKVPKTSSGVKAKVNEIVSEIIIEVIGHGIDKGYLIIRSEQYPDFLATMIQKSSYGFGVNIPKYNDDNFWTKNPVGKRILKINHNQFRNTTEEGSDDEDTLTEAQGKYRYTRILFVSGKSKELKDIDIEARNLIEIMRTKMVRVIVIFTDGLDNEIKNSIDGLDACLLNIDGNPFLLGTKFIGDFHSHNEASNINRGVEGIFYFEKQKAVDFFEKSIEKILLNPTIEGNIIETYKEVKDGSIDIVWTPLNHSQRIATIRSLRGVFST